MGLFKGFITRAGKLFANTSSGQKEILDTESEQSIENKTFKGRHKIESGYGFDAGDNVNHAKIYLQNIPDADSNDFVAINLDNDFSGSKVMLVKIEVAGEISASATGSSWPTAVHYVRLYRNNTGAWNTSTNSTVHSSNDSITGVIGGVNTEGRVTLRLTGFSVIQTSVATVTVWATGSNTADLGIRLEAL